MKLLSIFVVSSYAAVGDYYWNHYENYGLLGYIDHDPIETLEEAQELCISKGERCAGVTQDASGFTLRSELLYVSEPEAQTYVKGQIWAENFVPRAQWEARLPLGIENYFHHEGTGVIGHHTHWDRCYDIVDCIKEVKKVQDYHMDGNGWWDIGYNFLIGEDGRIYEGRGFHIQGAHCSGWNTQTLGFTIMGSFISDLPNSRALSAAKQLMNEMEKRGYIDERCWSFFGHRDKGNTACPGDRLYEEFKEWKNFHREC